jgi:ribosomal protein S18 acetylase RimI-like enzyme
VPTLSLCERQQRYDDPDHDPSPLTTVPLPICDPGGVDGVMDQANISAEGIPRISVGDATPEGIASVIKQRGCIVVESAVPEGSMALLDTQLKALVAEGPLGGNDFDGYATRRVYDPLARSRVLDDLVLHPLVGAAIELLIGPSQLGMTVLSDVGPGEVAQRLHRDAAVYPLPADFGPVMVNTIWAIDDFTPDNGATVLAPDSHRTTNRAGSFDATALTAAAMTAGSVLVYDGRLVHGAGSNRSGTGRLGVIIEHVARWVRPNENHTLAVPPQVVATLRPELQELLGYNQHNSFSGFVAGRPPLEWLQSQTTSRPASKTIGSSFEPHEVVVEAASAFERNELVALYQSVGWTAYTDHPASLEAAVRGSSRVVPARRHGRLVGLARVISDGASICYLQDVLVHPDEQRNGIGRRLLLAALDPYATIRQKVLLTDNDPVQKAFYESLGYRETRDYGPGTLRAFVRYDNLT